MIFIKWFGWSVLWIVPLLLRSALAALTRKSILGGRGSIRLWLGTLMVLASSCAIESMVRAQSDTDDSADTAPAADVLGAALAQSMAGMMGKAISVIVLFALAALGLKWMLGVLLGRGERGAVATDERIAAQSLNPSSTGDLVRRGSIESIRLKNAAAGATPVQARPIPPRPATASTTSATSTISTAPPRALNTRQPGAAPGQANAAERSERFPSPVERMREGGGRSDVWPLPLNSLNGGKQAPKGRDMRAPARPLPPSLSKTGADKTARPESEWAAFEALRPTEAMLARGGAASGAAAGTAAGLSSSASATSITPPGFAAQPSASASGNPAVPHAIGSTRSIRISSVGRAAKAGEAKRLPSEPAEVVPTRLMRSLQEAAEREQAAAAPLVHAPAVSPATPPATAVEVVPHIPAALPLVQPQIVESAPAIETPALPAAEEAIPPIMTPTAEHAATEPGTAQMSMLQDEALLPAPQVAQADLIATTSPDAPPSQDPAQPTLSVALPPVQEVAPEPELPAPAVTVKEIQIPVFTQHAAASQIAAPVIPVVPAAPVPTPVKIAAGIPETPTLFWDDEPEDLIAPAASAPVVLPAEAAAPGNSFFVRQVTTPAPEVQSVPPEDIEPAEPRPEIPLPALDLLDQAHETKVEIDAEQLNETGRLIEQRLKEFKVPVTVLGADAGPVITRFEVEPAQGVRGAQIVNLMKDLSRALGLTSIRVVETIPGKTCMGLELPNAKRQMIRLAEIVQSEAYRKSSSLLTLAMGKDITGVPVVTDLARAPHMLVAGTTGSGKSVAINAMILSLLYKATPDEVRMIMIDPKMLELSIYEGIPHLLAPVVTDMREAAHALNWAVEEMERRYKKMSKLGVRNLAGFNQKLDEAHARGEKIGNPFSLTPDAPEPLEKLPAIVIVIDELADLMMVVGKKVEELIARLAQKARAAGIHLILATQRPSVDVITGLIKANIPTRVAFQVSSKIDSRTVLDQMGAESLLGHGDMLFLPPGSGYPQRVHGAFVSDEEVHRVVEYLKSFGEPQYEEAILAPPQAEEVQADMFGNEVPDAESDPLYDEAVAFVLRSRRASISSVQRQFRIGYNRAARLVEQMETAGVLSAMSRNGSRDILVPPSAEE
ncbi:DNA translocase FtsK 4TM domain-containing protein [Herbaspirillum lusitanum]|uniref:DNA translocase FtsK 4TM domain-containing protein n=1 Tax=Herbaspirillum lusitanum TaxID=213312 RepID=A0ABW9AC96_9BURK